MEKSLTNYILDVCKSLNKHGVLYLDVGGTAVAFHGYFRWSHNSSGKISDKFDLDIWYNTTYDNYYRLFNSLEELVQDITEFRKEKSPNPLKSYFKFELEKFTLDFLPVLKGLSKLRSSFNIKETVDLKGIIIPFIAFDDLIEDEAANSRPKDLSDIKHLKAKRDSNS